MHKLLVLYPQPASAEAFLAYYEDHHLPMVNGLPGLVMSSFGRVDNPESEYFLIFEAVFNDLAALEKALASETGKKLAADVPNYSPNGAVFLTVQYT